MHGVVKIAIENKYGEGNAYYFDNSSFGMINVCFRLRVCCVVNVRLIVCLCWFGLLLTIFLWLIIISMCVYYSL